jgi:hypothetical protein
MKSPGVEGTALIIIVAAVVLYPVQLWWRHRVGRSRLRQWAKSEGVTLVDFRYQVMGGPFFPIQHGLLVYEVSVLDAKENSRTGHVKIGGFVPGLLSPRVEVIWD